jgi:hypothetical protein
MKWLQQARQHNKKGPAVDRPDLLNVLSRNVRLVMPRNVRLVMHEQCQENNNRKWNSNQPEQRASTKAHIGLHALMLAIQQSGKESVPSNLGSRALIVSVWQFRCLESPLLQHQLGLISDKGLYLLRELGQKPRQDDRQANMIISDIDCARGDLSESAYAELQFIPRPDLFLDGEQSLKCCRDAAKAGFQAPHRLFPAERTRN